MRTPVIALALLLSAAGLALAQDTTLDLFPWLPSKATDSSSDYVTAPAPIPIRSISPEDIEQDSIRVVRFSTNSFAVRFTYTEAGAKKMLAFRREHAEHEVITQIGAIQRRGRIAPLSARPPGWTEEGYLKHRGDKFFGISEDDAKKMAEGLRKK